MALRDSIIVTKYNDFLNLTIEGDFKIFVNCYDKKTGLLSLIIF